MLIFGYFYKNFYNEIKQIKQIKIKQIAATDISLLDKWENKKFSNLGAMNFKSVPRQIIGLKTIAKF